MISEEKVRGSLAGARLPSRKALPPFEALRAFDAVARLGGVRKAAQYLCRDHAVISRHLRTIEEWTGSKLIDRKPGGTVLTDEGLRYHRQIAQAIDTIANATADLMKRGDNHRLHLRCMAGFALHWLTGRLGEFEKTAPGLDVEIRPADRNPELMAHDADIEIRFVATYGPPFRLPTGLRSIEIAYAPVIAVASPEYVAHSPPIRKPGDVLDHQLLHEENFDRWRNWLVAHRVEDERELSGPKLWEGHLTLDAALHGRGIALTNHLIASGELGRGKLIEIGKDNPAFQPHSIGIYHFIAHADRWDAPLIRRFRQWLLTAIAAEHPRLQAGP
jgi:DNA-binding transcriptional LysR family regulator